MELVRAPPIQSSGHTPRPGPAETAKDDPPGSPAMQSLSTGVPLNTWRSSAPSSPPVDDTNPPASVTPFPHERSRLGQVFDLFRRRASSSTRENKARDIPVQSIKEAREQAQQYVADVYLLRQRLEATEEELAAREAATRALEATNRHAEELLKRNTELELMIATVQDEADSLLKSEKNDHAACKQSLRSSLEKIDELKAVVATARSQETVPVAVSEELRQLKLSVTQYEIDLASVRSELDQNRAVVDELRENLNSERAAVAKLQSDRKSQVASLADIGSELNELLRDNTHLEEDLKKSRAQLDEEMERHRLKLKDTADQMKDKDSQLAQQGVDLEMQRREIDSLLTQLDRLQTQNAQLQEKTMDADVQSLRSSQLSAQLAQSEERRRLEQAHFDECLQRMKSRLACLEGVQKRASELLSRNSELETMVSELRTKVRRLSHIPEGAEVRRLKDDLRQKRAALTGATETVRSQAADIKLLEKTVTEHKKRLRAAEVAAARIEQPAKAGPDTAAWQLAVEKVMNATREDARKEIDRVAGEYDLLLKSIRSAHSKELEQREVEFEARLRATATATRAEQLAVGRQRDLERQLESSRQEVSLLMLRKDQEIETYKQEFEKSFVRLQQRKVQDIRDQLAKKDEQCRRVQEESAKEKARLRADFEAQIASIKNDNDLTLSEKDAHIGQLEAQLAALNEKVRVREKEIASEIEKEANAIAEQLVEKCKIDLDRWMETQKRDHQRDITRVKEECKEMLEAAQRENDKLRLDNEIDLSHLRKDHEQRVSDLNSSLSELVSQATASLKSDLASLQSQLSASQSDRDKMTEDNFRLGRELNRLRASIDEKDAEVARLSTHSRQLESLRAEQLKEIQTLSDELAERPKTTGQFSETYETLLSRNAELEEMVADVSCKYHDELKSRMTKAAALADLRCEYDNKIRTLTSQTELLKSQLMPTTDENSEADRASMRERLSSLAAELTRLESDKHQLVTDLGVERTRVAALRQQLSDQSVATSERRRLRTQLIQKIKDIEALAATWGQERSGGDDDEERAKTLAEKHRLEAEVGSLKNMVLDRQKTVSYLETSLRAREAASARTDAVMGKLQSLQSEREGLLAETKMLEASLKRQETSLQNEIQQRDVRLKKLASLNDTLATTLHRNTELEAIVQNLLQELGRSCAKLLVPPLDLESEEPVPEKARFLMDLVDKFEEEFRSRAISHEEDLKNLGSQLDDRELEISKLQVELKALRVELETNVAEQLESQKLRFEARINRLSEENTSLVNQRAAMEADLMKIRSELADAQTVNSERVNAMIADLTGKLKDQQLEIAEIQTEKAQQAHELETMLRVSQDVHKKLKAEIERISAELAAKENDILELTKSIKDIMAKEGFEDFQLDRFLKQSADETAFTGERWAGLMGTLESLFVRLSKSQKSAKSLTQMLNALLQEQQESLRNIAASQAAAIENHSMMCNAVRSEPQVSETLCEPSFAVHGGDLSLIGDGLVSLKKELNLLRATRKSLLESNASMVTRRLSPSGGSTTTTLATTGEFDDDVTKGKRRLHVETDIDSKRARLTP